MEDSRSLTLNNAFTILNASIFLPSSLLRPALFFACFLYFSFCQANEAERLFRQGNEAYQSGDYAKSIEFYEQVLALGYRSAELEYNLGNAYFRQNNLGKAILHYERAWVLKPGDKDIRHNLSLAREQVHGDIDSLPAFFLVRWWKSLRGVVLSGGWGVLALLLWWLGFTGLVLWLLGKNRTQKKIGFFAGFLCLVLSLLPFSLAFSKLYAEQGGKEGIIMQEATPMRSAPDNSSKEIMLLPEGLKVSLLDQIGDWMKVRVSNGEEGWLVKEFVEKI